MQYPPVPIASIDAIDLGSFSDAARNYIRKSYASPYLEDHVNSIVKGRRRLVYAINQNQKYYFGILLLLRWMEMTIDSLPVFYDKTMYLSDQKKLIMWEETEGRTEIVNGYTHQVPIPYFRSGSEPSQRNVEFRRYLTNHRVHTGVLRTFTYLRVLECRNAKGELMRPNPHGEDYSLHLTDFARAILSAYRPWIDAFEEETMEKPKSLVVLPAFTVEQNKLPIGVLMRTQFLRDRKNRLRGEIVANFFEDEIQEGFREIDAEAKTAHPDYVKSRKDKFLGKFYEKRLLLTPSEGGLHTYLHNAVEPIVVETVEEYEHLRDEQREMLKKVAARAEKMGERIEKLRQDRLNYMQQEFDRYARTIRDTSDDAVSASG